MKIQIDLGTVDVEMQRSDGTWEKVDHCHTRIRVEKDTLSIDLKAALSEELRSEIEYSMKLPPGADGIASGTIDSNGSPAVAHQWAKDAGDLPADYPIEGTVPIGEFTLDGVPVEPDDLMKRLGDRINAHGETVDPCPEPIEYQPV